MTKLLTTNTFKIALIGSFVTVISLAICGTVIELNRPTSGTHSLQSQVIEK